VGSSPKEPIKAIKLIMQDIKQTAEQLLKTAMNNPQATFRDGQWESIEQLLHLKRVLVVQHTGWGKSMVYFLATKLLRDQGAGLTLLISPLLSLMRNQIEAAERLGIKATTINSTNQDQHEEIKSALINNEIDVLIISPERLGNEDFRNDVLSQISGNIGLFVIDEAHCISDWGHDFRPDYRRIIRLIQALPKNMPILATTATANNRVVADIKSQLGDNIIVQRGSLVRKSLKLQNINMPSPPARMAWLAQTIPTLNGSGIVYTLTQRDAEKLTQWLQLNGINAKAYHSDIGSDQEDQNLEKESLEQQLLNNEIKVLVSTVALGMGFDKPDLTFVIHFQRPASVVHYYQQVGRAGRAVDQAYGILLAGEEDDHIANYFIQNAFPPQQHIAEMLKGISAEPKGLSVVEMQKVMNLKRGQIDKTLKFLTVESPSPVTKINTKWRINASAASFRLDQDYVDSIIAIRRAEQQQMRDYMEDQKCLMSFLQIALDDPNPKPCGQCKNCQPALLFNENYDEQLATRALKFLHTKNEQIIPKKQWPAKDMFEHYHFETYRIPDTLQPQIGRALSIWRDAGHGKLVADGKKEHHFDDELLEACVRMYQNWAPQPAPRWVTCVPSHRNQAVKDFAMRFADAIGLPFSACLEKVRDNQSQREMANSYQQVKNLDGAFRVNLSPKKYLPCLLIDDVSDSGWTLTVACALLRQIGCTAVYPMVLALNPSRLD
jgi:ATP-dependent DNA helicase RecQ